MPVTTVTGRSVVPLLIIEQLGLPLSDVTSPCDAIVVVVTAGFTDNCLYLDTVAASSVQKHEWLGAVILLCFCSSGQKASKCE